MSVSRLLREVSSEELSEWMEHWHLNAEDDKRTAPVKQIDDAD